MMRKKVIVATSVLVILIVSGLIYNFLQYRSFSSNMSVIAQHIYGAVTNYSLLYRESPQDAEDLERFMNESEYWSFVIDIFDKYNIILIQTKKNNRTQYIIERKGFGAESMIKEEDFNYYWWNHGFKIQALDMDEWRPIGFDNSFPPIFISEGHPLSKERNKIVIEKINPILKKYSCRIIKTPGIPNKSEVCLVKGRRNDDAKLILKKEIGDCSSYKDIKNELEQVFNNDTLFLSIDYFYIKIAKLKTDSASSCIL